MCHLTNNCFKSFEKLIGKHPFSFSWVASRNKSIVWNFYLNFWKFHHSLINQIYNGQNLLEKRNEKKDKFNGTESSDIFLKTNCLRFLRAININFILRLNPFHAFIFFLYQLKTREKTAVFCFQELYRKRQKQPPKVFFLKKSSQNSQENTCARAPF